MTDAASIVVLGVGNTLMQDDGVGVWAVRTLAETYELPARVRLVDAGVAGLRCLPEFEGAERLLIIDAVSGKEPPGAIYHLTPDDLSARRGPFFSAHEIGIAELLSLARFLGKLPPTRILGIQPQEVQAIGLDLTPALRDALPRIIDAAVEELRALGVEPIRSGDGHA